MDAHHFLESLAEKLGSSASVKTVYGEPIEASEAGKTIIPVARVAYGLGGGYGKEKTHDREGRREERPAGESGGGGITISPLGVFEVSRERTGFVPLRQVPRHLPVRSLALRCRREEQLRPPAGGDHHPAPASRVEHGGDNAEHLQANGPSSEKGQRRHA